MATFRLQSGGRVPDESGGGYTGGVGTARLHRPGHWVAVLIDVTVLLCVALFIVAAFWVGWHILQVSRP